jgi:L-amino acid N-acyltransferase YncA
MSIPFSMRIASLDDLPSIISIYNQTIPGRMVTADLEPVRIDDRLNWYHAHQPTTRPLWVALDENSTIMGWISLQNFYGREAYRLTAEISIYLDQTHQGKGLGTQLLREAIIRSQELGIERLLGFIFTKNSPSIRLFERAGFECWGCLPGVAKLDGESVDLSIYGLKLDQLSIV